MIKQQKESTMNKQQNNQLSEVNINSSGLFTMHQLGVRVQRSTDPKQKGYIQNRIKNAIHRYDT